MHWYRQAFRRLFEIGGRSRRREYWVFVLTNFVLVAALGELWPEQIQETDLGTVVVVLMLAMAVPASIRRLHDTGRSGWWLLLGLTFIGFAVLFVLLALDGERRENDYGLSPKYPDAPRRAARPDHRRRRDDPPMPVAPAADKHAIHGMFADLIEQWLRDGIRPDCGVEGVTPGLCESLGTTPIEFSFDSFIHPHPLAGWSWERLEMADLSNGALPLYIPDGWEVLTADGPVANVIDVTGRVRQTIFLVEREQWAASMVSFLQKSTVDGWAFEPLGTHRSRWVFVTARGTGFWAWAVYDAGDRILLIKGDAGDASDLRVHLTSLTNADPWGGWREAAL